MPASDFYEICTDGNFQYLMTAQNTSGTIKKKKNAKSVDKQNNESTERIANQIYLYTRTYAKCTIFGLMLHSITHTE